MTTNDDDSPQRMVGPGRERIEEASGKKWQTARELMEKVLEPTEGERRVGVSSNPSDMPEVDATKWDIASMIDVMLAIAADRSHPGARAAAIAATKLEEACMWQVKALTAKQ